MLGILCTEPVCQRGEAIREGRGRRKETRVKGRLTERRTSCHVGSVLRLVHSTSRFPAQLENTDPVKNKEETRTGTRTEHSPGFMVSGRSVPWSWCDLSRRVWTSDSDVMTEPLCPQPSSTKDQFGSSEPVCYPRYKQPRSQCPRTSNMWSAHQSLRDDSTDLRSTLESSKVLKVEIKMCFIAVFHI